MLILLYNFFKIFNIRQKYIAGDHLLTSPYIFSGLISSMFVSDLYGLMQHILYLFFVGPHYNVTVILVQHCVITNGNLNGVPYLYAV